MSTTSRDSDARDMSILVVDDNLDAAESLSLVLELWGHRVRIAHDGPSAIAAAIRMRPEVVVLDIGLPGMDGYRVAAEMRRHPELSNALLVALTGYGQEDDQRRSREAGFDHHLVKPVEPFALQELLARRQASRGRTPPGASASKRR
jgi:CheY-like chemotaxis protein